MLSPLPSLKPSFNPTSLLKGMPHSSLCLQYSSPHHRAHFLSETHSHQDSTKTALGIISDLNVAKSNNYLPSIYLLTTSKTIDYSFLNTFIMPFLWQIFLIFLILKWPLILTLHCWFLILTQSLNIGELQNPDFSLFFPLFITAFLLSLCNLRFPLLPIY